MGRENVEAVRRLIDANNSDDIEFALATAIELTDPDAEFTSIMAAVEPVTFRGHEGMRGYFADMEESWQQWTMHAEEVVEVAPDVVLATLRTHLVGRGSGVTVAAERAGLFEMSAGRLVSGRIYANREDALDALEGRV